MGFETTMNYPLVSIVTVNYNGKKYLKNCFNSLDKLNYPKPKLEFIMVDNGSSDDSVEFVKRNYPEVKIILNDVNNYCRANNLGIKNAKGKFIALLNNDMVVSKDWLEELLEVLKSDKSIGVVGSKILFMDGKIQSAGHEELPNFYWVDRGCFENSLDAYNKIEEVNSLCGGAVLYRKDALEQVDYFDEDFNMYIEDVDISIRLRKKGWKLVYVPKSLVRHIHHGTAQKELSLFYSERNRLLLLVKHYPKKLSSALLGRGYFTVQRDIEAYASIYRILTDVVLKLIKHHKTEIVKEILNNLFTEFRKISNYENSILKDRVEYFLKIIESDKGALKEKDQHITNLNLEISRRNQLINDKDAYIKSLNLDIENIYNSTAFKFIVKPLWGFLWKIKQAVSRIKSFRLLPVKCINAQVKVDIINKDKISLKNITICTIISKNCLSHARVLTESFLQYNKGEVFVLLTDKVDGYFDPCKEKFTLIEIDALKDKIEDFDKFCFQYNVTELNTAVKPFFLEFLFERYQFKKLIFLDPDILITNNLDDLLTLLDKFSVVLIPHITQPFRDSSKPAEIEIIQSGVYNLGFIALSNTNSVKELLKWWKEKLLRYCKIDIQKGLFVDQKWIELIPGFFDDVFILRDESYNIAYWNFHYRKVYFGNGKILVNGHPAHFLHFSGFNPKDMVSISKHQNRFTLNDLNYMKPVFELYKNKLVAHDYNSIKNWPCVFNYFDNGVRIPDIARKIFWEINCNDSKKFKNPFITSEKDSYFAWLKENVDTKQPLITKLMHEIYKQRLDVHRVYPDIFGSDRKAFVEWFLISAKEEYDLDDSLLESIISFNVRDKKIPRTNSRLRILSKIRNALKIFLKKIFRNNLRVVNRLRVMEMHLLKKVSSLSNLVTKKTVYTNESVKKYGVNVLGYLTAELGVGEGARGLVRCLQSMGLEFSLINISPTYSRRLDLSFSEFSNDNSHYINLIHINADVFPMFYREKGREHFKNKYNIGFWTWELSDFPDEWISSFQYCNEIWTPSNFTLASIAKRSFIPVIKIPHAVVVDKIKKVDRRHFGLSDHNFIFLFVFDFLSYFERKNPLAIINAFRKAFSPTENVRLVIKCSNSSFDPLAMNSMKEATKGLNINIIDKYLYKIEVNALMSLCDCYVSLHRSEGFGLTMAEAMFLGRPVIATGFSGNMDFMNINNSYLVKYNLVPINKNVGPYKKGSLWAEPDIHHASELMRYVYENRATSKKMGEIASTDIKNNFNFKVIGNEIKHRLNYIYNDIA